MSTDQSISHTYSAPAKINRFLHVTGRRDDGYHEIETVFQFLELKDTLRFTVLNRQEIIREGDHNYSEYENDLIIRAAKSIQNVAKKQRLNREIMDPSEASQEPLGVRISIEKNIPAGSGLGGGSSNAATTLIALNQLWNVGLTRKELMAMGLALGADVPVFIFGQSCWATGIGEVLEPHPLTEDWYCVAIPDATVSTQEIFCDPQLERNHPPLKNRQLTSNEHFDKETTNTLQPTTTRLYPNVGETVHLLAQYGPTRMSGSGSAVFLRCESQHMAHEIAKGLPEGTLGFATRSLNHHPHSSDSS